MAMIKTTNGLLVSSMFIVTFLLSLSTCYAKQPDIPEQKVTGEKVPASGEADLVTMKKVESKKSTFSEDSIMEEFHSNPMPFVMLTLGADAFSDTEDYMTTVSLVKYKAYGSHAFNEKFIYVTPKHNQLDTMTHALLLYKSIVKSRSSSPKKPDQRVFLQFPRSYGFTSQRHFMKCEIEFLNQTSSEIYTATEVYVPRLSAISNINELFSILYSPISYKNDNGLFECLTPDSIRFSVFVDFFSPQEWDRPTKAEPKSFQLFNGVVVPNPTKTSLLVNATSQAAKTPAAGTPSAQKQEKSGAAAEKGFVETPSLSSMLMAIMTGGLLLIV